MERKWRRVREEEGGGESVLISSSCCCCSARRSYIHEHPRTNVFCELCQHHNPVIDFYQQVLYLSKVGFVCFNVICMLEFFHWDEGFYFGSHCKNYLRLRIRNHQVRRFVGLLAVCAINLNKVILLLMN